MNIFAGITAESVVKPIEGTSLIGGFNVLGIICFLIICALISVSVTSYVLLRKKPSGHGKKKVKFHKYKDSRKETEEAIFSLNIRSGPFKTEQEAELLNEGLSPVLIQIRRMRELENTSQKLTDSQLFVLQAELLADLEDTYTKTVPFQSDCPAYAYMSDDQLRCYLTWRSNVRKQNVEETSLSYVLVYCCELINNINATDAMDSIRKLVAIWLECRKTEEKLDDYLINWVKEYYICNDFSLLFTQLIEELQIEKFYPEEYICEESEVLTFANLSRFSNYKFENSKFLKEYDSCFLNQCFDTVLINLRPLFYIYGLNLKEVLDPKAEIQSYGPLFRNALYQPVPISMKRVFISESEYFECVDGDWICCKPVRNKTAIASFIGYIIKRVEAQIRILENYRYKLSPDTDALRASLKGSQAMLGIVDVIISDVDFNQIIDTAAAEAYKALQEDRGITANNIIIPLAKELINRASIKPYSIFREMRSIGIHEDISVGQQFYLQAQLLADLSDGDGAAASVELNPSVYYKMTNGQLCSYLAWRTKLRNGEKQKTTFTNIYIYANEILNDIGVGSPLEGFAKLADVLLEYQSSVPNIEKLVPALIKDYFLANTFSDTFVELVKKYKIQSYYSNVFLGLKNYEDWFDIYIGLSNYKIKQSKFYTEQTDPMIRGCFNSVINKVSAYFKDQGLSFTEVLIGEATTDPDWSLFPHSFYHQRKPLNNKIVALSDYECYQYKAGVWACLLVPQGNPAGTYIIGYILKRLEAVLRELTKFKYKLSPNISKMVKSMAKSTVEPQMVISVLLNPLFDETIDTAVMVYFEGNKPKVSQSLSPVGEMQMREELDTDQIEDIRRLTRPNQSITVVLPEEANSDNELVSKDSIELEAPAAALENEWTSFDEAFHNLQKQA